MYGESQVKELMVGQSPAWVWSDCPETLSSGAGTMTYTASNLMSALNTEPLCVDWDFSTVEAANSAYGLLPSALSRTFAQSFGLSIGGKVIHKVGTVRHKLSNK